MGQPANKVFIVQKRTIRIICAVSPRTNCRPLFSKLGILTLTAMFVFDCLIYIKNNMKDFLNDNKRKNGGRKKRKAKEKVDGRCTARC